MSGASETGIPEGAQVILIADADVFGEGSLVYKRGDFGSAWGYGADREDLLVRFDIDGKVWHVDPKSVAEIIVRARL